MDMGAGFQKLLVAGGFAVVIALVEIIGVVLGAVGLRQAEQGRLAAQVGTAFNALGLFVIVALLVVGILAA